MTIKLRRLLPFILILTLLGCAPDRIIIQSVKSSGVDQIPKKFGIYPFLSTRMTGANYTMGSASLLSMSANIAKNKDNVAITPGANTELAITQESQILTDLLSSNLSSYGFALKQLPVDLQVPQNPDSKETKTFFISLNLLDDLRTNYGMDTIILCDAFFTNAYQYGVGPEKRVISANIKVIDTKTLDVLAQVTLPYNSEGCELNDTASQLATSLAKLANIPVPNKSNSQ